jgi:uncharacterized protein YkwD
MVVQTAQALATLSAIPGGTALPTDTPPLTPTATPTFTPTITAAPTLVPVIGDAIVMMAFVMITPTAIPAEEATPAADVVIAELVQATPVPTVPGCPTQDPALEGIVIELINAERAKAGLNALSVQEQLREAAQGHSTDMACSNYFSHFAPDGSSGGDRITRTGYKWSYFGENIAAGYITPSQVVKAWMDSPSHKANILNKYYVEIGVGYAYSYNSAYGSYWTVVFGKQ